MQQAPKQIRKKLHHYNTPGHAHELRFSCYRRQSYFYDPVACQMFLEELERSRSIYSFKLWAYVLMPHHVHLLIWPLLTGYDIGKIESGIKGIMAKKYCKYIQESNPEKYEQFLVRKNGSDQFIFWQRGGGFDRNFWNAKAIHDSVNYIENNPVRAKLVATAEEWQWSSRHARNNEFGVIPDTFAMPVKMLNPQVQRIGAI